MSLAGLFAFCSFLTLGFGQDCGLPGLQPELAPDLYVLEGNEALEGVWPWMLSLQISDNEGADWTHVCGAVLIDANFALTAAHCVNDESVDYRVVAGEHDLSIESGNEQYIAINEEDITIHPDFDPVPANKPNDIAILRLSESADMEQPHIGDICLPPSSDSIFDEYPTCFQLGWGEIDREGTTTDVLQQIWVDVMRPSECVIRYGNVTEIPEETITCTIDNIQPDFNLCQGDFGGPLHCMVDAQYQVAGIASFNWDNCNPNFPTVFSSTSYYLDWILAEMEP